MDRTSAGLTDVKAETLEQAAALLMLRRDTFRIIDGAGPDVPVENSDVETKDHVNGNEPERQTVQENERTSPTETAKEPVQPAAQPKCTFHGEVPIDFEQFLESGVSLVECPDCTSTSALAPHKEILHFKPHKRRKTRSTSTEPRWAKREMIWAVVSK
jgi:hypothetical protein